MTEILIALIAAFASGAGLFFGRLWGRAEGKHIGKTEAENDARTQTLERMESGRAALGAGRRAGDPAERLRQNDGRW